jgi:hypothetical protein
MRSSLRVLARDPAREQSPGFEAIIRKYVTDAPGVLSIISIEPHRRGGFSVIVDRVDELPDGFEAHFEHSALMWVI